MTKFRSPVLGFNHNIRHRGWLFHVQTEDSGVSNPHIFTHLFRDGVIIATRKVVYDSASDTDVVKGLMQAQHKAVLRDLKNGHYDEKIKQYLGEPPEAEGATSTEALAASAPVEPAPPIDLASAAESTESAESAIPTLEAAAAEASTLAIAADEASMLATEAGAQAPAPVEPPSLFDAAPVAALDGPPVSVSAQMPAVDAPSELTAELGPFLAELDDAPAGETLQRGSGPGVTPERPAPVPSSPQASAPTLPETRVPERNPRSWVVARPGMQERPFEKSGSFPAVTVPPEREEPAPPRPSSAPARHLPEVPEPPAYTPRRSKVPQTQPPATTRRPTPAAGMPRSNATTSGTHRTPPTQPPARASAPLPAQREPSQPGVRAPVAPPRRESRPPPPAAPPKPDQAVVVARPAVVIGAPPTVIGAPPPQPARRANSPHGREQPQTPTAENIFGQDLISEKSLDEVIMAYLSEDSNEE